ncbi:MAG: hypothetical protein HWN67_09175 [Candidatus Helarchaeota archaeon]|nr:hypothetical protein [Candidatus Helarchaeota archaeon]
MDEFDEKKIIELINNIDKDPDPLHNDITPAVLELAKMGGEVFLYIKDLLSSSNEMTRLHAQKTHEYGVLYYLGWIPGRADNDPQIEVSFKQLWKDNGDYQYDASEEKRDASIESWMNWYNTDPLELTPEQKEKIIANIVEPDITVEYLFVEKAERQIKPINDDQGYLYAFINIFVSGNFSNDNVTTFKNQILDELNYCVKTYDYLKSEKVDFKDYKFGLVDNDKNITEFEVFDEEFYEALKASLRNLAIVGKNFDLEKFKNYEIFTKWFEKYSNRS